MFERTFPCSSVNPQEAILSNAHFALIFPCILLAGCSNKPILKQQIPTFQSGVGTLIAKGTAPQAVVQVCGPINASTPVFVTKLSASDGDSSQLATSLAVQMEPLAAAKLQFSEIDSIVVTLEDGQVESAPLSDIFVPFRKLSKSCRQAIQWKIGNGAGQLDVVTAVYRGRISVETVFNKNTSVEAKARIIEQLQLSLGVGNGSKHSTTIRAEGVWPLASEFYLRKLPKTVPQKPTS